ncbi:hypothetical protein QJQ45_025904 [Haematococcus lacustris]|nr:hypothetical protein QJQ45_025904 [Haematococcus lacustris]
MRSYYPVISSSKSKRGNGKALAEASTDEQQELTAGEVTAPGIAQQTLSASIAKRRLTSELGTGLALGAPIPGNPEGMSQEQGQAFVQTPAGGQTADLADNRVVLWLEPYDTVSQQAVEGSHNMAITRVATTQRKGLRSMVEYYSARWSNNSNSPQQVVLHAIAADKQAVTYGPLINKRLKVADVLLAMGHPAKVVLRYQLLPPAGQAEAQCAAQPQAEVAPQQHSAQLVEDTSQQPRPQDAAKASVFTGYGSLQASQCLCLSGA